jgi:hypothetical protein
MSESELLTNILRVSLKLDTTNLLALFRNILDKGNSNELRLDILEQKYVSQSELFTKFEQLESKIMERTREMVDDCSYRMKKDMQAQAKAALEKDINEIKDSVSKLSIAQTEATSGVQNQVNNNYAELVLMNKKAENKITTLNATVQQLSARNRDLAEALENEIEKTEKIMSRITRMNETLSMNGRYSSNTSDMLHVHDQLIELKEKLPTPRDQQELRMESSQPITLLSELSPMTVLSTSIAEDPLDFEFSSWNHHQEDAEVQYNIEPDAPIVEEKKPETKSVAKKGSAITPKRSLFPKKKTTEKQLEVPKQSEPTQPLTPKTPKQPLVPSEQPPAQEIIHSVTTLDEESAQQMRDQRRMIAKMHREIEDFRNMLNQLREGVKRKLQLLMDSNSQRMYPLVDQMRKEIEEKLSYKMNKKDAIQLLDHKADKLDLEKWMIEIGQQIEMNVQDAISNADRRNTRQGRPMTSGGVSRSHNLSNFKLGVNNNSLIPIGYQSSNQMPNPAPLQLSHQQHPANQQPSPYDVGEHAFDDGRYKNDEIKLPKRPHSSMDDRPKSKRSSTPSQLRPLSAMDQTRLQEDNEPRLNIVGTDGVVYKGKDANLVQLAQSAKQQTVITGLLSSLSDETYQRHVPLSRLDQKGESNAAQFTVFQPIDFDR